MGIRSFIAVDPSAEVLGRLGDLVRRLERQTKGFRWVRPEAIHLTLRFLGEIGEDVLETVGTRMAEIAAGFSPISISIQGIGFFPGPTNPRIVWSGLRGETEILQALHKKVEAAVADLPVHREKERPFTPHLTLARASDPRTATGVARILQEGKDADFGSFEVGAVILYKSRLTPKGSEYTKLKEFSFRRP